MPLALTCPAISDDGALNVEHTCDGRDRSPPIAWEGAPAETRSFSLTVVDLDARCGDASFAHWVVFDVPATGDRLPGTVASAHPVPGGGLQGRNDFRRIGWSGPCPPAGTGAHRYAFRLYALDVEHVGVGPGATLPDLLAAMEGHVVEQAEVVATCARAVP